MSKMASLWFCSQSKMSKMASLWFCSQSKMSKMASVSSATGKKNKNIQKLSECVFLQPSNFKMIISYYTLLYHIIPFIEFFIEIYWNSLAMLATSGSHCGVFACWMKEITARPCKSTPMAGYPKMKPNDPTTESKSFPLNISHHYRIKIW